MICGMGNHKTMWKVTREIVGRNAAYYVEKDGHRFGYIFWTERSAQNCADELNEKDKAIGSYEKQEFASASKRRGRKPRHNKPMG